MEKEKFEVTEKLHEVQRDLSGIRRLVAGLVQDGDQDGEDAVQIIDRLLAAHIQALQDVAANLGKVE